MGTSYIPFPPWAIAFCFAPLWIQVLRKSPSGRSAFFAGWWTQFILSIIGFYWVAYVSLEYGHFPWPVAILCLLIFAATVHSYFALASLGGWWIKRRLRLSDGACLFVMASLVSLAETWWPSLFPWNLGYTLYGSHSPLAQWADVIGFWGLSFCLHQINALMAYIGLHPKSRKAWAAAALVALTVGFLWATGAEHGISSTHSEKSDNSMKILEVQANIGNLEKYYAERGQGFELSIASQYFDLTRQALAKFPQADLIVWPESAYPDYIDPWDQARKYSRLFYEFVREIKRPILTGGYSSDPPSTDPKIRRREYNGLFVFDENANLVGSAYHKTYLLAYGEYTPGANLFPWMAKYSPAGIGFARGQGPSVINFKGINLGVQICYESLYPEFSEVLIKNGAQILVNLTNDSWFGPTFEPLQHMYMTLARAVETRRPLIRSTNTGISTVALASGEILDRSPLMMPWFEQFDVTYAENPKVTFYVQYGAVLPWLVLVIVLLILLKGRLVEKFKRS